MHKLHPIKTLNSWRTGNHVKLYSKPNTLEELVSIYHKHISERTIWLGLGSNILFPDELLDAHIIHTVKALSTIELRGDVVYVESGVTLAKTAKFCARYGYEASAFLAGIPGTIGGALNMNAGAYGSEIWQYVVSAKVLTDQGIRTLRADELIIQYRRVILPKDVKLFLSAILKFPKGCATSAKARIKHWLLKRNSTQPIGTFNCGSVFKNPEGKSAGKMIDDLGLLGHQMGHARVSPKHGNFIENIDMQASTKDILSLITYLKEQVLAHYGVSLELEVTIYDNI